MIYDQGGGTNAFTLRLHNGMLQLGFRANGASVVIAETAAPPAVLDPDVDGDGATALVRYSVPIPADATPAFLRLSVTTD